MKLIDRWIPRTSRGTTEYFVGIPQYLTFLKASLMPCDTANTQVSTFLRGFVRLDLFESMLLLSLCLWLPLRLLLQSQKKFHASCSVAVINLRSLLERMPQ